MPETLALAVLDQSIALKKVWLIVAGIAIQLMLTLKAESKPYGFPQNSRWSQHWYCYPSWAGADPLRYRGLAKF